MHLKLPFWPGLGGLPWDDKRKSSVPDDSLLPSVRTALGSESTPEVSVLDGTEW
jgi:hypothetical protein